MSLELFDVYYMRKGLRKPDTHTHMWAFPQTVPPKTWKHMILEGIYKGFLC